ncbi:hypothetical protein, partial [Klebsiella pneumoniae]
MFWQLDADTASLWLTTAPPALDVGTVAPPFDAAAAEVADEQGLHRLQTLPNGERIHILRSADAGEQDKLAALI